MLAEIDKKKISKVVRKTHIKRRRSLLKDEKPKKRCEARVIEIVDISIPNLWEYFTDVVLRACDGVSWKGSGNK